MNALLILLIVYAVISFGFFLFILPAWCMGSTGILDFYGGACIALLMAILWPIIVGSWSLEQIRRIS